MMKASRRNTLFLIFDAILATGLTTRIVVANGLSSVAKAKKSFGEGVYFRYRPEDGAP
jgi:hypothetical protein